MASYGSNFCTGGTASAERSGYSGPSAGFDGNTGSYTQNDNACPYWWKYDLGAGVAKIAAQYTITVSTFGPNYCPSEWVFAGSNNDSDWTTLDSQIGISWNAQFQKKTFEITNAATAYRYYRWNITASGSNVCCISEFGAMELIVQTPYCYLYGRKRRMCMKPVSGRNQLA